MQMAIQHLITERIDIRVIKIMSENVSWNRGLKLDADGYTTPYYRKD
nr:MAG TPA: hypothetical protein [Caudoviricetes sp.]